MNNYPPEQLAKRQFAISTQIAPQWPGACTFPLSEGCYLHHCPTLPVRTIQDSQGNQWHLLGIAFSTEGTGLTLNIDGDAQTNALQATNSWSGRWCLIGAGALLPDAGSLLSCYFLKDNAAGETVWASSSLALLAALSPSSVGDEYLGDFQHGQHIEWYPLPGSQFANVQRLLPTQNLNIQSRTPEFNDYGFDSAASISYEEAMDEIQASYVTLFMNIANEFDTIYIPLTAGMDSRLLLALAHRADCKVSTFTHQHSKIDKADRSVPKKVARIANVPYQYCRSHTPDERRREFFDAFTHRFYAGSPRERYTRDQWRDVEASNGIFLSGNCIEVGRRIYEKRMAFPYLKCKRERILKYVQLCADEELVSAAEVWLDWSEKHPLTEIDLIDRFYIEQRLAGWYANVELAFDLSPLEHYPPNNCRRLFRLLLSMDLHYRKDGAHQIELIRRSMPELLQLPINPMEKPSRIRRGIRAFLKLTPFERVRRRVRKRAV